MRRFVTGIVVAGMLAASQAGATATSNVQVGDRAGPEAQRSDQMMGDYSAGWLITVLGVILIVVAVVDGNNRHDEPSSP